VNLLRLVSLDADALVARLSRQLDAAQLPTELREFPDGECYVRVDAVCRDLTVAVVADLSRPNPRLARLLLLAATLKDLGAARVLLVAPYLPYMRQDARFRAGEGITAHYFARLVSAHFDGLVTIDPHLHRIHALEDVYTIPCETLSAAPLLAAWIAQAVPDALLIGPDAESAQWTEAVARAAAKPSVVLEKVRHGDREVEVTMQDVARWRDRRPVLVDDIISTGRTLVATGQHLARLGFPPPLCVAVHAVFAGDAEDTLDEAGLTEIVTSDSIPHRTNRIAVDGLLADGLRALLAR
jgi:ribose-phosphate pyrophosphokinase